MQEKIVSGIKRALRRVQPRPARAPAVTPPRWQTVARGPLAGLSFWLPAGRNAPWAEAIRAGEYEAAMLGALAALVRPDAVLYDIGAHIGFFTCAWLRLGGGRVEAFEPLPSTAAVLGQTIRRNNFAASVRVHPCALGNFNGPGQLIANEADLGAASAAFVAEIGRADWLRTPTRFDSGAARPVPVYRLDDLVAAHDLPPPALLKIDVEGAEAQVLAGAAHLLTTARPVVLCELHRIDSAVEVTHQLAKLGYQPRFLGQDRAQPAYLWTPS